LSRKITTTILTDAPDRRIWTPLDRRDPDEVIEPTPGYVVVRPRRYGGIFLMSHQGSVTISDHRFWR
jgi:hypothetical protein